MRCGSFSSTTNRIDDMNGATPTPPATKTRGAELSSGKVKFPQQQSAVTSEPIGSSLSVCLKPLPESRKTILIDSLLSGEEAIEKTRLFPFGSGNLSSGSMTVKYCPGRNTHVLPRTSKVTSSVFSATSLRAMMGN